MSRWVYLAVVIALAGAGCGGTPAAGADVGVKSPAPAAPDSEPAPRSDDPLFPARQTGWKHTTGAAREAARALAGDYLTFLGRAQTPRRAIAALVDIARAGGGVVLGADDRAASGGFYISPARGGTAAVFYRPGSRPITDGLNVVIVSVDAPRIVLKQRPVDEVEGFAMLQTRLHGRIDLASWMVHPLALYVYVDRGRERPTDLAIGAEPGDPVLSIPDVLPHLSGRVQRRDQPVDDPERLDAIAARDRDALLRALKSRGVSEADLTAAEAYLIPATAPLFAGADRGLIGGYGQQYRALAFAAVRGLAAASPERAAVVVAIDRTADSAEVASGHVTAALADVIGRLAPEADVYDAQRSLSRSRALVAMSSDKGRNQGVQIDIRAGDSFPPAIAEMTRAFDSAGVHYSLSIGGHTTLSRMIGNLDLDSVEISIAVSGVGTPGALVSILDLFHGFQACRVWLST